MSSTDTPKVFITHSWHDIEFARKLYDDLVAHGYQVWFDDKTLQGGHRMAEEINRGLEWCDAYLPILSPQSLESSWCWEEINAAISLSNEKGRAGRPRVIPILVHNCEVPAILRGRLYINLAEQYPTEITKVFSAIDAFRVEQDRKQWEHIAHQQTLETKTNPKQVIGEKPTSEQPPTQVVKPESASEPKSKSLFARIQHLVLPMIVGNVAAIVAVVLQVVTPTTVLFFVPPVVFAAGIYSAVSHKQTVSSFRIRRTIVDGFWGGFVASVFLSLYFFLYPSFYLLIWGILTLFGAGIIGAIGGGGWGIVYKSFFAGRRS